MEPLFNKIAIIGVGLMGGSLGMACKQRGLAGRVIGYGRSEANLRVAVECGAIDSYQTGLEQNPQQAGLEAVDLVVLATPVGTIIPLLEKIAPCLKPGVIVTDVGSTKANLVSAAEQILAPDKYFVGGHPIAGTEKSGAEAAFPQLFVDARCVLTPTARTNSQALQAIQELWQKIGSKVVLMDVQEHDYTLAAVSHLPHVVAYSLVNTILGLESAPCSLSSFSGGGFRDFTRVAGSDALMWRDICLANKDNICRAIDLFQGQLLKIKALIQQGESSKLLEELKRAKQVNRV